MNLICTANLVVEEMQLLQVLTIHMFMFISELKKW